jgi:LacI family transcriptional regulator
MDDFEGGRLLVEYLLDRGHRRIALLATTLDRPGDKLLFDGISDPLSRAGLPHNSLVFQVVANTAAVGPAIRQFLEMPDPPTAFVARNERLADKTASALSEIGLHAGGEVEVVFLDHATEVVARSPHPHVQTKRSREEGARLMGEMLRKLHEGQTIEEQRVVIPVEFCRGKREKKS